MLRRHGFGFLLVGLCFIPGLIDGEALKDGDAGAVVLEEIDICKQ